MRSRTDTLKDFFSGLGSYWNLDKIFFITVYTVEGLHGRRAEVGLPAASSKVVTGLVSTCQRRLPASGASDASSSPPPSSPHLPHGGFRASCDEKWTLLATLTGGEHNLLCKKA